MIQSKLTIPQMGTMLIEPKDGTTTGNVAKYGETNQNQNELKDSASAARIIVSRLSPRTGKNSASVDRSGKSLVVVKQSKHEEQKSQT